MTGSELLTALRKSGTPDKKLEALLAALAADPKMDGLAAFKVLEASLPANHGTTNKAKLMLGGDYVEPPAVVPLEPSEVFGPWVPPKRADQKDVERMEAFCREWRTLQRRPGPRVQDVCADVPPPPAPEGSITQTKTPPEAPRPQKGK